LENCRYLPKLNNEKPGQRNSTYKERFSSLENLVLIMVSSQKLTFFDMLAIFNAHFMSETCLFVVLCCNTPTVWARHSFNTKRNILVWLLSRWILRANFTTARGTFLIRHVYIFSVYMVPKSGICQMIYLCISRVASLNFYCLFICHYHFNIFNVKEVVL
jgi:hypothetical protein